MKEVIPTSPEGVRVVVELTGRELLLMETALYNYNPPPGREYEAVADLWDAVRLLLDKHAVARGTAL